MAFEIIILADGEPAEDLTELATSVQVEQSLDDSARYTVRFDVDLDECGEYPMLLDERLRPNAELAFLVKDCSNASCLVAGPVTGAKIHIAAGGAASWVEVTGGDRRISMDRIHWMKKWEGPDNVIVQQILAAYDMKPDVDLTPIVKTDLSRTTNQSSSDTQFIRALAAKNPRFHFWISYEVDTNLLGGYKIREVGHFKPSPTVALGSSIVDPFAIGPAPPRLEINIGDRTAQSMGGFDIDYDAESPNAVVGFRVGEFDTTDEQASVDDPADADLGSVERKGFLGGLERTALLPSAGDPAEHDARARAALAEAEWFLQASVTCTRYSLLGRIIQPHMVVPVVGLGKRFSGDWFVIAVSHTVDNHSHTMNVTLARNSLGA